MLYIRGTSHGPVSVCLSVRHTSRSSIKTAKRRITQTTQHSPGTLVFWSQWSPRNSTAVTPAGAPNAGGVGQNRQLSTNNRPRSQLHASVMSRGLDNSSLLCSSARKRPVESFDTSASGKSSESDDTKHRSLFVQWSSCPLRLTGSRYQVRRLVIRTRYEAPGWHFTFEQLHYTCESLDRPPELRRELQPGDWLINDLAYCRCTSGAVGLLNHTQSLESSSRFQSRSELADC